jgi:hypothetical protein
MVLKQIIFDQLWACKTVAGDAVMPKRKDFPKQAFSNILKVDGEIVF